MNEHDLQQKKKMEVDFSINEQPVHFEHQLLDPQSVPEQVEITRSELHYLGRMDFQTMKANAPVSVPLSAQQQPGQELVQAEPQQTYKQRREIEKQQKKDISDGKAYTRNADTETIKIVRKMQETAPQSDGPDGFQTDLSDKELDTVVYRLINTRITPDMFTPENFAANSAMLRESMYKYKKLGALIENYPEYFDLMKKTDLFKFKALERCIAMAEPLEHMFMVASGASGLLTDGGEIKEKNIVEHARNVRAEQLESFRKSVKDNDEQRERDISEVFDEKLKQETFKYQTLTKPEFQRLYHGDNPEMDWIKVPSFNYMPYFEETQAMRGLIEAQGERYLGNKEIVDKMLSELIGSLEVYGELKAKSSALGEVQVQYQEFMNNPRGGDGDVLFRRATSQITRLGNEGNDVIAKFELIKSAMKTLLRGQTPNKIDTVVLANYGYGDAKEIIDPIRENVTHLASRVNWQGDTLDRLLKDERVHVVNKDSQFVTRAPSMFREHDDEYNINLLNFLQDYEKKHGKTKPAPEAGPEAIEQYMEEQKALYGETKQRVMPSVQKILDWDAQEALMLDDEQLASRQAELDDLFGDNMFVADLMKLKKPDQPDIELKEDIIGDKMDEYVFKLSALRGLAEKSRGLAMKNAAKYGLLTDDCFTETEFRGKIKEPADMTEYADSRIELGNRLIETTLKRRRDEHDPNSEAFKAKCKKLYEKKPGLKSITERESPFDDIAKYYESFHALRPGEQGTEEEEISHRLSHEHYRLAGWSEKEAKENGYPEDIGEALFRGFRQYKTYDATQTMTIDEYKQMLMDLGKGRGMESGVTPPQELREARERNMRGARQFKETIRLQYDMFSRKYGTAIENMSVSDIYDHYEEILRDFANVQVDLDFITKLPGIINPENPEDKIITAQVEYFSLMGANIQQHLQYFANLGNSQEDITKQMKTISELQCGEHKKTLLESPELSHISTHIDWTQKVGARRRPIE